MGHLFFARVDASLLFDLDLDQLASTTEASLLSQYRFLRALELGFGLWAMLHRHAIHDRPDANRLFLSIMAAGVAARLISLALDGSPSRRGTPSSRPNDRGCADLRVHAQDAEAHPLSEAP